MATSKKLDKKKKDIHEMTVTEAQKHIVNGDFTAAELDRLMAHEMQNEKHPGGRKGVMDLLEGQIAEARAAFEETPTTRADADRAEGQKQELREVDSRRPDATEPDPHATPAERALTEDEQRNDPRRVDTTRTGATRTADVDLDENGDDAGPEVGPRPTTRAETDDEDVLRANRGKIANLDRIDARRPDSQAELDRARAARTGQTAAPKGKPGEKGGPIVYRDANGTRHHAILLDIDEKGRGSFLVNFEMITAEQGGGRGEWSNPNDDEAYDDDKIEKAQEIEEDLREEDEDEDEDENDEDEEEDQ